MLFPFLFGRPKDAPARPPTEREVLSAGDDYLRKQKLVDRFPFLPEEVNKTAKDTALSRFLEVLFSHLRS